MSSNAAITTGDGRPIQKKWSNPFTPGTPLHELFGRRIRNGQDLVIIIDDWHARRGTGKTVAALQLAAGMDQTEDGITKEKVAINPEQIRLAYEKQPVRSGLVLDEAEVGVSKYKATSNANQAIRQIMSMGRIQEKYVVINTPMADMIDKEIRKLADVWITMLAKGVGLVHYLERQPYSGQLLTPKKQLISFVDIPASTRLREVYNHLTREKKRYIGGEGGGGYVPRDELKKAVEKAEAEAERGTRNDLLRDIYRDPDVDITQRQLAAAVGLSVSRINEVLNDA